MLNENVENNDLTNTAILSIAQIDTENKTDELLVINNSGETEWESPTNLEINVEELEPSPITNDILVTNNSGQIAWQKIENSNIENLAVNNSKISDVDFSKVSNVSISESMLQNNSVSNSKIESNVDVTKLVHPSETGEVLLSETNTTPKWDYIANENLAENCVNDNNITAVNFNKITNTTNQITEAMMQDNSIGNVELIDLCVTNAKIDNATIQQSKIVQTQSRRYFVDYTNGVDAVGRGFTQQYAWKTLEYAIDNCEDYSCIEICDRNVTGNIVIENKSYVTIMSSEGLTNSTQCVLYTESQPFQIGTGCNSIKFKGVEFDTSNKAYNTLEIDSGNHYFESCSFETNASYSSCVFGAACAYVEFKSCEFERPIAFYEQPTQASIILLYENCDIHSISNTYAGANFIVKDANINEEVVFANGSLLAYETQFEAGLSFTSASPNILFLQTVNSFNSTTFQDETISQTNTALYYISSNSIYKSNSVFSGVRIFPKYINNNDIEDHTISAQKLQALTANRFVSTDASGYISTKEYVENDDVETNTIALSKLENGTNGKTLIYENGVLTETDFPSSVFDYSQLTNTTEISGFVRLNGASPTTYETQLADSDISGISFTKINSDLSQANKYLFFDENGVISTETESNVVEFSNIEEWPSSFGTSNVVFADGSYNLISLNSFNSGNNYLDIIASKRYTYAFKNILLGNDIITENSFISYDDIVENDLSAKIIPFSKIEDNSIENYGTAFFGKIGGSAALFRITSRSTLSTLFNNIAEINWEHIETNNSTEDGWFLQYDEVGNSLKWAAAGGQEFIMDPCKIRYGSLDVPGINEERELSLFARIFDSNYFNQIPLNNSPVPVNRVMCIDPTTPDKLTFKLLEPRNISKSNSANNGDILCYESEGLFEYKRFQSFVFDYNEQSYPTGYTLLFTAVPDAGENNAQLLLASPKLEDKNNSEIYEGWLYGSTSIDGAAMQYNTTYWENYFFTGNSSVWCMTGVGNDGVVWGSRSSNGTVCTARDVDGSSAWSGASFAGSIRLQTNSSTWQTFSSEQFKDNIYFLQDEDNAYLYETVTEIQPAKFRYTIYDNTLEKHKERKCDCKNEDECDEAIAELIFKCNKKHYSYTYENIAKTKLKNICNRMSDTYFCENIEAAKEVLTDKQKIAFEKQQEEVLSDDENKFITMPNIITALHGALSEAIKKINILEARLEAAGIA